MGVGVLAGVATGVVVNLGVGVGTGTSVGVSGGVGLGVKEGAGVGFGVEVGASVGVEVGVGMRVGVWVGVGAAARHPSAKANPIIKSANRGLPRPAAVLTMIRLSRTWPRRRPTHFRPHPLLGSWFPNLQPMRHDTDYR